MFRTLIIGLFGSFLLELGGIDTNHIFPYVGMEYQVPISRKFALSAEAIADFNALPTSTAVSQVYGGVNFKWMPDPLVAFCFGEGVGTTCYHNGDVLEPNNTHYLAFYPHLEFNAGKRLVITGGYCWTTRLGREAPHSFNSCINIGVKFRLW